MSKKSKILIIVALGLCLVSTIFAGLIQTDFCKVEMKDITIETDCGTMTGILLIPETATKENPAPAVVTSHGYLNNAEMQDCNWVELARRGYVVFAMNAYNHGDSSVSHPEDADTPNVSSGGMIDIVEFVYTLDVVDPERIGVTGHSMGGGYTMTTANYYTQLEREALANGATPEEAHKLNKVAAAFVVGNYPSSLAASEDKSGQSGYLCHLGVNAGQLDEFFVSMSGAPASQLLVTDTTRSLVAVQTGEVVTGPVEEGKIYKNAENGYIFVIHNPYEFHAQNHFSIPTVRNLINFFEETLGAPNPIPATNQTWWLKEAINCIGLIGFFMFVVPFTELVLTIPAFAGLKAGEPVSLPAFEDKKAKRRFVSSNIWSGIVNCIFLMPLLLIGYIALLSPALPQDTTGGVATWCVGAALIGLCFLRPGKIRKQGGELGVKMPFGDWVKTLIVSLIVVAGTYLLVFASDYFMQTDFRVWSFDIRVFSADKIWVAAKYLPFFLAFYFVNAISSARCARSDWSDKKQVWMGAIFNMICPVLFLAISYIPALINYKTLWGNLFGNMGGVGMLLGAAGALVPILIIPFVPILGIAGAYGVKFYKMTGKVWLGALINAILITMITIANTSFSFAY